MTAKKRSASKKKRPWFVATRKSYLPAAWQGYAIYALFVAYMIGLLQVWCWQGHDIWKLLTAVLPLQVAATLITQVIASKNS